MVCIYCGNETKVTNSRLQKRLNRVWRRRQCLECTAVFTTLETPDLASSVMYEAEDGHMQPFDRDKLFTSIYESLKHRPTAIGDAGALSQLAIGNLLKKESGVIARQSLTQTVSDILERFDAAAYTAYKAFHPTRG